MNRPAKILRNTGIALAALIACVLLAALVVVHTAWFRDTVRQRIIASTEDSTGGTVTLGSFAFDVSHTRATLTNFVIHGKEPSGAAPFLRVAKVQVGLRLFGIGYLGIEQPQANVVVFPDGTTNLPSPRTPSASPLATVVDLEVGRFDLSNGLIDFNDRKREFNLRGNHLRALLNWNVLKQSYQGQLSMEPVYMLSGRNTPVVFKVTLPAVVERDRIAIRNARVATAQSDLRIDASVENMKSPVMSAHVNGHIALADLKDIVNLPIYPGAGNVPATLGLDANATVSADTIQVAALRITAGQSNFAASGTLRSPQGKGALEFKAMLALGELGRLARLSFQPEGEVALNGTARLDAAYNYAADGNIEARNISMAPDRQTFRNIQLLSAVHADPHNIQLRGLHISALGGEFTGHAEIADLARYRVEGDLRNFDLRRILRLAIPRERLPYDGIVSGAIDVTGDIKTPGLKSLVAATRLSVSPGHRGIPVSGRFNADYRGSNDRIALENSFVSLPHSRITLSGSVDRQLNVTLASTDLHDFPAVIPLILHHGRVAFTGTVAGRFTAPLIDGHLTAGRFSIEGRQFDSLQGDLTASQSQAAIRHGTLTRAAMRATFDFAIGLSDWIAAPRQRVAADVQLRDADLADVMALAGEQPSGYSGALTADAHITGTVGNPEGSASIQAANGLFDGEPFDRLQARVALSDRLIAIPAAYIASGSSRIDISGDFQHPRDTLTAGRLHVNVQTNQINLAQIKVLQKDLPNTAGTAQIHADVTGNLGAAFLLTSVNGSAALRGLRIQGQHYGDFTASARSTGRTVTYQAHSDFSGASLRVNGSTELTADYPTTADATIRNLQIAPVLALLQQSNLPAKGVLSGSLHLSGTIAKPQGSADVDLASARIYDEPLDRIRARITYLANSIDVRQFEAVSGKSRIDLTARYQSGQLQFRVSSNRIDLARIDNLQKTRPGLGGSLQVSAEGIARIRTSFPRVLLSSLNANLSATGLSTYGKGLGDLSLTANTTAANRLNFALQSNLAGSSIQGSGNAQLTGNYPVDAQLSFKNVTWPKLEPFLEPTTGKPPSFEAAADGQVTINGPALDISQLRGALTLSRLNVTSIPRPGSGMKPVGIRNDGVIQVSLDHGSIRLQNAKLTGTNTTIQATGTASLANQSLNLTLTADADLTLLRNFSQDIDSAGRVVVATTIRGRITKPLVNGTLELRGARLHYAAFANGISNANGTIVFNGNSATIRNLSAESGGGTVIASGFVGYTDRIRFGLRTTVSNARLLIQQGISAVASADMRLTGTAEHSVVAGTVTIETLNYRPQSDIGSILSIAAPPVQGTSITSPLLLGMRLDIRVRTAPALAVQASLAQNLQLDADLRIRGTAAQPGVLGRITISEGKLVFFGSTYTVNSGSIGFYNPVRIDPVLDISLETQAKGVDVVLHVTGPIDNLKLSYTSDPPLQFQEIIALLAAGRVPTSDPTLLANQPSEPQQTFQQMGESAVLDQALANPVSGRLQRVFGVTQLKIDPTFIEGSQLPQARLSLQQQITSNITFTYVSALNDPNTTVIRVEWAFNQHWSAVASRDENGIFSINFFYKKQFR